MRESIIIRQFAADYQVECWKGEPRGEDDAGCGIPRYSAGAQMMQVPSLLPVTINRPSGENDAELT